MNFLYKDKTYNFAQGDVYDNENMTKLYTTAYLQTEYEFSGIIFEDLKDLEKLSGSALVCLNS